MGDRDRDRERQGQGTETTVCVHLGRTDRLCSRELGKGTPCSLQPWVMRVPRVPPGCDLE